MPKEQVYRLEITSDEQLSLLRLFEWFSKYYGMVGNPEIRHIEEKLRKSVVCVGLKSPTIDYEKLRY